MTSTNLVSKVYGRMTGRTTKKVVTNDKTTELVKRLGGTVVSYDGVSTTFRRGDVVYALETTSKTKITCVDTGESVETTDLDAMKRFVR